MCWQTREGWPAAVLSVAEVLPTTEFTSPSANGSYAGGA
jgi:hypothetical protein